MFRRCVLSIGIVGLCAVTSAVSIHAQAGQAPPASQAVVIKGHAPVSNDLLQVKLPRPVEADLPNGLHLIVLEDHRAPQVSFQILVRGAGGFFDPAGMPGLASATATLMREGTTTRTTQQISETLETMAASVGVGAGLTAPDATVSGSCLTENFGATFALAADVLLHPIFPDDEIARWVTRQRASLTQQRSSAAFLAAEAYQRAVYGAHPASRVSMTADVLGQITHDALATYHHTHYVPDHGVIAFAGDISMAEARKAIDATLAEWKKTGAALPDVSDPPAIGSAKVLLVARPGSVQTTLLVGTQAIARTSPDYDVLQMMNKVIGGGPTGRLFIHLREEKGYTYGASSGLSAPRYRGDWQATMDVRTEVTDPALTDLMAEIARMRDEAVPQKEFQDAQRALVAAFALSLESPQGMLNSYIARYLYQLPADYWDRYPARVMAVTPAQVQAAARQYLAADRLQIVAVGDAARIGGALKKFGTVETYDADGKRIGG